MPLRGYLDNDEIISFEQTDEQWNSIKQRLKTKESALRLSCCLHEGFLRRSNKGLKHFVHSKTDNSCDWKPESSEHLKAKIDIIEACKVNGWEAIPEFAEANWKADVLATQGNKKIAFEVQWSKQTFEETQFRQDRYNQSNVRGCWFFRTAPKELRNHDNDLIANKEIPAFKIFKNENGNIVSQVNGIQMPLKSLVISLLNRKFKFCKHIRLKPKQEVTIVFFSIDCWKCKKSQHLYTVERKLLSVCNQEFHIMGPMWDGNDIDKNPQIFEAVKLFIKTKEGEHLKIGQLKKRYSKTVQNSYLSHGCFYCDAIWGDYPLIAAKMEERYKSSNIRHIVEIDLGIQKEDSQHWCYSESEIFCE
ncbi:MAG: competence protein CoiA [Bacteroidales bacterium]